jgi:hypothetical protein
MLEELKPFSCASFEQIQAAAALPFTKSAEEPFSHDW